MSTYKQRYPRRPPRVQLFQHVEPLFMVNFNTYFRKCTLAQEAVHNRFRAYCESAYNFHISVGRYVIMPDHVHVFVHLGDSDITLGAWVKGLKSVVGKQLIESGYKYPHWQEGFVDHVLRSDESYSQKWDYVRENPVRAGLCPRPEDWPFQGEVIQLRFE